jgi:hypothetical protein
MDSVLVYIASGLTCIWGIAHLFPTKNIVDGFGEISEDNRQIITMEWIIEGASLIFIGLLVGVVTFVDPLAVATYAVYLLSMLALLVLALISIFTGFRVNFLPFKLCPFIFGVSAVLILVGGIL